MNKDLFKKQFKYIIPKDKKALPEDVRNELYDVKICITEYIGDSSHVEIPDEVDGVPISCILGFGDHDSVTSVVLPSNECIVIAKNAFSGCPNLETVKRGKYGFIYISGAFDGCTKLFNNEGVLIIDDCVYDCLKDCKAEITIPKGVKTVYSDAFQGNSTIEKVIFTSNVKLLIHVFYNCSSLKEVIAQKNLAFDELSIGNCPNLEHISVNGKLAHFDPGHKTPFDGCPKLIKDGFIVIKNVLLAYVGDCNQERVVIPEGVTAIGSHAFKDYINYKKLEMSSLDLRDEVEEIWEYAFEGVKSLQSVTGCGKIKKIGKRAFANCRNLEEINYPSDATVAVNTFENCTKLVASEKIDGMSIANGVLHAFSFKEFREIHHNDELISIKIPDTVQKVSGLDINAPGLVIDELIVYNTLQHINPDCFMFYGINSFKVINQNGDIIVDKSFYAKDDFFLANSRSFRSFCKAISSGVYK